MAPRTATPPPHLVQQAQQAFRQAVALHQQGRIAEAEDLYRAVIRLFPDQYDALHLLGVCALQRGEHQAGVDLIQKSLAHKADNPQALVNLGNGFRLLGRHDRALRAYEKAARLRPDEAEPQLLAAQALLELNRPAEALAAMDRLLARSGAIAPARTLRGCALCALGRFAEGLAALDAALALDPGSFDAHLHRGHALHDLGRGAEALAAYDRALGLRPDSAEAHAGRGKALLALKRTEEALAAQDRAIALDPRNAGAQNGRGLALLEAGLPAAAAEAFRTAIALAPGLPEPHCNLGIALIRMQRPEEAAAACGQALALRPRYLEALLQRGTALLMAGKPDKALRDMEEARRISPEETGLAGHILHARMQIADWRRHEEDAAALLEAIGRGLPVCHPFDLLGISDCGRAQLQAAESYVAARVPAVPAAPLPAPRADGIIRVGYLSSDFRNHPVTHLLLDVLRHHDRNRFEVHALSLAPDSDDPWQAEVRAAARYHDLSRLGDAEAVRLARGLGLDIAVDLNGHTQGARTTLLAARLAPVQVNYLGFVGTMGAGYIDYVIGDEVTIPAAHAAFFREKAIRLPLYQPNAAHLAVAGKAPTRAEAGLPEDATVFCCFCTNYKITPAVFGSWMRILAAGPGSVLWIFAGRAAGSDTYRARARQAGIDPRRIVFAPFVPLAEHLARHALADLFLDTFPYNGGATVSNALRMGLPVVTRMGEAFASRMGASLLRAAGLPELATTSAQDYEAAAIALGAAPERLAALKQRLRESLPGSPLFDPARTASHLEQAFAIACDRARAGLPPEDITIAE